MGCGGRLEEFRRRGPAVSGDTLPATPDDHHDGDRAERARILLETHWRAPGFCVPNATTYPWQWLWDSCFHSMCWAHLGEPDRAVSELSNLLAHQSPDGFVPHMTYWDGDTTHRQFWRRAATSSITQPPMYGHAVAQLLRGGVEVPAEVVERSRRGLRYLFDTRVRSGGGLVVLHPWESGCDDSPRWDAFAAPDEWSFARWKHRKGELVEGLRFDPVTGSPVGSAHFEVASVGFNALVAFNAQELADVIGDEDLAREAAAVVSWLDTRWDGASSTWIDDVIVGPSLSAGARTLDALLPVLVCGDRAVMDVVFDQIRDPAAFGGGCGPAGVHRGEAAFDPRSYWRGPAWPQVTYLLWLAATRQSRSDDARWLVDRLTTGVDRSGWAEYWHPDTGAGLGAIPQSWAALVAVVGGDPPSLSAQAPLA